MKILSKIRFLPITIFFAMMMLTVKIDSIWNGIVDLNSSAVEVATAEAQTAADPVPDAETAIIPESMQDDQDEGESDTEEEDATALLVTNDPTLLTLGEIELLQKLSIRRQVLETRERELDMRSGLLSAAELRIDNKIVELNRLRETIDGLIRKFDVQEDTKLKSLVKIYENMKPKDAARIFENLELETLLEVAERMKERKLAPIMAKMDPEKAREMTVELRQMRRLPATEQQIGG